MMTTSETKDGINRYYQELAKLQEKVILTQHSVLLKVSEEMVQVIQSRGRIFVFGTGHSHLLVEEAFFRAGGLAAVVPIFMSGLMLHEKVDLSGKLERTPGLARDLLDEYDTRPGDMMFVISNSGVNQVPVEMAMEAKKRKMTVVAICSIEYSKQAPLSRLNKRLEEVADYTIDNCGVPGDALYTIEGTPWRCGPSSTIIGAMIWQCLIANTFDHLKVLNIELPIFLSYNVKGAAEHNEEVLKTWWQRNPHIRNRG